MKKNQLQKQHIQVKIYTEQSNLDLVIVSFKNSKKNSYKSFSNSQECPKINMFKKFDTKFTIVPQFDLYEFKLFWRDFQN